MSDLISRQDVLAYPIRADHYDRENGNKHFIAGIESVMEYVECLPSAEPKTPSNGSITCVKSEKMHDRTMGDLISRQDAKDAIDMALDHIDHVPPWVYDKLLNVLNEVPSAEKAQLSGEDATKDATSDLISKKEATTIPVMPKEHREYQTMNLDDAYEQGWFDCQKCIEELPSAEPEGKWTTEEVAELLFNLFGDECACNYNGIDEWLPERCKYTEIADECPNPKEKHGCWMQFLLQGGADMRGEKEETE